MNIKEDLVEWIETMHLQNTNGRETGEEMFRLGIEAAIEELPEFNLLSIPDIVHQREQFKSMMFDMANKLAIAGHGDEAVAMHRIHNRL